MTRDRRMATALIALIVVAVAVQLACAVLLFDLLPWPWALAIIVVGCWSTGGHYRIGAAYQRARASYWRGRLR